MKRIGSVYVQSNLPNIMHVATKAHVIYKEVCSVSMDPW